MILCETLTLDGALFPLCWFRWWLPDVSLYCRVVERGTALRKWTSSPGSVLANAREACLVICESGTDVVSCPGMADQCTSMYALALTY
jgi:hypothetical protein